MTTIQEMESEFKEMHSELKDSNDRLENVNGLLDQTIEEQGKYNMLLDSVHYKINELKAMRSS